MEKELLQIDTALQFLVKEFEEVAGRWNGKDEGSGEEVSAIAKDIIEKATELRALLDEYNNL